MARIGKPDRGEQHPARAGGVAVAVLPAATGDEDGVIQVALAVEQAHQHVSPIDLAINAAVAGLLVGRVLAVFLLALLPGVLPVVRIGLIPGEQIAHHLRILAVRRDGRQRLLHDLHRIAFKKRHCIHRAHELPGIDAIAVIHQPPKLFAQVNGGLHHPGRNQARIIRLDLVINVVGTLVELGMAGIGRGDAAPQVVAPSLVGAPKWVAGIGKIKAGLAHGAVKAVLLHRPQKGHLHIKVILAEGVVNHLRLPLGHLILGDDLIPPFEFSGRTPGDPGDLPDPCSLHLVAVFLDRQAAVNGLGGGGRKHGRKGKNNQGNQLQCFAHGKGMWFHI
ncbi:MAG: hypothetical protein NTW03_06540, partial [Verrucomicrobia bacterium]|nr:hypothetical protein [Verrucomicrobiota bacterium]